MTPARTNQNWLPSIFNEFLDNNWLAERRNATAPAVNIIEDEDEYKVEVAAPGMTREDFKVHINEDNELIISLEKKSEEKEEDKKRKGTYLRREFSYTQFQQSLLLPDNVVREKIAAKVENGVMTIEIPKKKETEAAVAAARQARTEGDMEKARFGEFAKLYLNLTNRDVELPKTLEDIRDIYDKIALDEIDDKNRPDGELFRKGDVEVQGPHGTVIHSGVSSEARISALLAQMMDLARSDTIPFLQRAIASHFLFEYIHPFYDGNGRTGRYLLALYLSNDLTLPTVLSLSRTIAENKNEYYKAFTEAEDKLNSGELTFFVYTILGLIERAQESLIEELGVKIDQLDKATVLRDELRREHALSTNATLLLYAVMQEELFDTTKSMTLEDAGGDLMLTKQTIRKYVDELAGASLIEFTGRRPLRFRASGALRTRIQAKREWGME